MNDDWTWRRCHSCSTAWRSAEPCFECGQDGDTSNAPVFHGAGTYTAANAQ